MILLREFPEGFLDVFLNSCFCDVEDLVVVLRRIEGFDGAEVVIYAKSQHFIINLNINCGRQGLIKSRFPHSSFMILSLSDYNIYY